MKVASQFCIARLASVLAGAALSATAFAADVTPDRLANSEREPQNWLNHHGNYASSAESVGELWLW
jgi:hypothetical protein